MPTYYSFDKGPLSPLLIYESEASTEKALNPQKDKKLFRIRKRVAKRACKFSPKKNPQILSIEELQKLQHKSTKIKQKNQKNQKINNGLLKAKKGVTNEEVSNKEAPKQEAPKKEASKQETSKKETSKK